MRTRWMPPLLAACLLLPPAAAAQNPNPNLCEAWSDAPGPCSMLVTPGGNGTPLTACYGESGAMVDATIHVIVRDGAGDPIPGYPRESISLDGAGWLALCPIGIYADHDTDANGETTISRAVPGGSYGTDTGELWPTVDGIPVGVWNGQILFNSPDYNGDGMVDLTDGTTFGLDLGSGEYHYRSDFNFDRVIDAADQDIFELHIGEACALPADPNLCTASTDAPVPCSMFVTPEGNGTPLTMCYDQSGGVVDATIHVTVLDGIGNPIPGYPKEGISLAGNLEGLVQCPFGIHADHDTDALGMTTITGAIPGGAISSIGAGWYDELVVTIDGTPLPSGPLPISFNSADYNGDCLVDSADESIFNSDYLSGTNPFRSDFNNDGQVNLTDAGLLAAAVGEQCYPLGSATVEVTPDDASWTLENGLGYFHAGLGDETIIGLYPGTYTLTWQDLPCWTCPDPNPAQQVLDPSGLIGFTGVYIENGIVAIDSEPDDIGAGWKLTGPLGFDLTAYRDTVLQCMDSGEYTLQWLEAPGWILPCPDTQIQTLAPADSIWFGCTYGEAGTIVVDVGPDVINPCWTLLGPASWDTVLCGDHVLDLMPAGDYHFHWHDVVDWVEPLPNPAFGYLAPRDTVLFGGELEIRPEIRLITDVGNDQGGQARIGWRRVLYDAPDDGVDVTGYAVFRRQDQYKKAPAAAPPDDGTIVPRLEGWDYLLTVPARGDTFYQTVAPTLCDSTDIGGICWSSFMVSALSPDPMEFWDSRPDSGYTVDNLAPISPQGLVVAYAGDANELAWEENPETDIREYRIYKADLQAGQDCAPMPDEPAGRTGAPVWADPEGGSWDVCYYVTAVDFAGNESPATVWSQSVTTGVGGGLPTALKLHPNAPNPFNPRTTITFDLPESMPVRLEVYDMGGRLVRVLAGEAAMERGRHQAVWDGRDRSGRIAAAGVYVCRLLAGGESRSVRMVLLK